MTRRLGILGGTFDPVHFGHLDAADAARQALALDEILLIPSHDPPHRPAGPCASAFHRFAMAALAITDRPAHRVSDLELRREGRSYTMDTLHAVHAGGWAPSQIFFILGTDAFADIAQWHAYPAVLDAAHFVVVSRPGTATEAVTDRLPALTPRLRRPDDRSSSGGGTGVYVVEAATRDVSSTMIRQRRGAGLSIGDLVPPAVARHILAHHLYATEDGLHDTDKGN